MNNFICFVLDRRTRIGFTYGGKCSVIRCNSLNIARLLGDITGLKAEAGCKIFFDWHPVNTINRLVRLI